MIAFYYLLRVGEYTIKGRIKNKKQTVQLKLEDAIFFCKDKQGHLRKFTIYLTDDDIITDDGATLKLDNHKNGWKGVCVF